LTHPKLDAKEKRTKTLILTPGYSVSKIAKTLKVNRKTVYRILDRLVYYNEIRPIPGTKSPIIYEEVSLPEE